MPKNKKNKVSGIDWRFWIGSSIAFLAFTPAAIDVFLKYQDSRASLVSSISYIDISSYENGASIFLAVTVSNPGSKKIIPQKFKLFIENNGNWISFDGALIKEYPNNIDIANPLDLQTYDSALVSGNFVRGFLKFTSTEIKQSNLESLIERKALIKLVCQDTFNKEYESFPALKKDLKKIPPGLIGEYPKHRMKIYN